MKYNIGDVVLYNNQSIYGPGLNYSRGSDREGIIIGYNKRGKAIQYKMWLIKSNGESVNLFDTHNRYPDSENDIGDLVFQKMFRRKAPYHISLGYESKKHNQLYLDINRIQDGGCMRNQNIIDKKIGERDNKKYIKVLAAIAKAEAKARAIT